MSNPDNYSLRDYGRMIADSGRTVPYVEALRRAVRPGASVLDIGTGPGFFALLACRLGAARVYAVEPDDAIDIGRASALRLTGGERITWIRGLSTEIDLPESVDVVIGDLRGTLPFYTGNLAALIDARRRHLKAGGVMIPCRDTVYAVPAEAEDEYACLLDPWDHNCADLDLTAGRRFVVNQWWRAAAAIVPESRFFGVPQAWARIDYRRCESTNASGRCNWGVARDGWMHGYYVWFDAETAEGVEFSNAPHRTELVYGRAFFPLERPVPLAEGDEVEVDFAADLVADEYLLRWNTRITGGDGVRKANFVQSNFASRPVIKEDLLRSRPDYRPELGESGRADLIVLEGMSQGASLADIAARLVSCLPERFKDPVRALRHATDVSLRYADRTGSFAPRRT